MSSRYFSNVSLLSVLPTFVLGLGVCGAAQAASGDAAARLAPPVQTYADQVFPTPPSADYYDSPLAAGTLTLQDVLDAHKPNAPQQNMPPDKAGAAMPPTAPLLTPPTQPGSPSAASSAGLMMSQGMKAVLQDVGKPTVPPIHVRDHSADAVETAQTSPVPLTPAEPPAATTVADTQYQPGQAPKNLGALTPVATATSPASTQDAAKPATAETLTASASTKTCDENVQKWEKTCGDAGYPATYIGKVDGETRTNCTDGTLHDSWVMNSCVPPETDTATSQPVKIEKTDALCGTASDNDFNDTPSANLCAQGIASAVHGEGPWTWACSGINGGTAEACVARKQVPARDGACGTSNGTAMTSTPSADLCAVGTASAIKGAGPWTWVCKGQGKGSSQSCIASVVALPAAQPPAVAETETQAPEVTTPKVAVASDETRSAPSAPMAAASEKGELCGAAAETLAYEAPEKDLCRAGTASVVNGDGPWTWSCTDNEGTSSTCKTLSLKEDTASSASAAAIDNPLPKPAQETQVAATASEAAPIASPPQAAKQEHFLAAPQAAKLPTPVAPAPAPTAKASCGFSAGLPAKLAPVAGLCQKGTSSAVYGKGPWHWTCGKESTKVLCEAPKIVDASCGPANGEALNSTPAFGLCSTGETSNIQGTGPWTWSCKGIGGGVSVTCAASLLNATPKVDGSCGTSDKANLIEQPTSDLCTSGTPSAVNMNGGTWVWSCSGVSDGTAASCSANKVAPPKLPGVMVNGQCGGANGVITTDRPSDDLCAGGKTTAVVGGGPWNWNCIGENGGMTVSCTAPMTPPDPIDGDCGSASGAPTPIRPQSGLCAAGITGTVNGKGPWTWTCSGVNGGTPAACIAPVTGKSGAMPSIMTPSTAAAPASVAPRTRLVTPQLPPVSSLPTLVAPHLASAKAFATAPAAARIPAAATVDDIKAPDASPNLPEGVTPLQPPTLAGTQALAHALPPAMEASSEDRSLGNTLELDSSLSLILFTRGSGNITDAVADNLDRLANVLLANPEVRISLYAYADNAGATPRDARRMSLTRALIVRDYLVSKHVDQSRIDVHAEGANTSKAPLDRIDIKVNN